jgi:3-oxoadipate enol-lactonase
MEALISAQAHFLVSWPCLVLTGEFDGGCNPCLNEFMHGELPDSRLLILEGLKHALMIEASDKVLPPLREFLLQQS